MNEIRKQGKVREIGLNEAYQMAFRFHQNGNIDKAVEFYRKILSVRPNHPDALHLLGVAMHQKGDNEKAVNLIRKAVRLAPGKFNYCNNLGLAFQALGKIDEAIFWFRKSLEIKPDFPEGFNNLGAALNAHGKLDEAIGNFRAAVKFKPDYYQAHYNLANAYKERNQNKKAIESYNEALKIKPDYIEALNNLGGLYQVSSRFENAIECFEKVLKMRPYNPGANCNLGKAYLMRGRVDDALAAFEKVLEKYPENEYAIAGKADILMRKADFEGAYRFIKSYVESGSKNTGILVNYAQLAGKFSDGKKVAELLESELSESTRKKEENMQIHFSLGKLYNDAGEYDKAFHHYKVGNKLKGLRFNPENNRKYFEKLMRIFREDTISTLPVSRVESERPLFIVGMPRSGTSLVEQILSSHPKVYGAGELMDVEYLVREIPDEMGTDKPYPDCLEDISEPVLTRLAERYIERLDGLSVDALRVTDKMPQNFIHLGVISLMFPKARIIHCKRDMRDCGLSIFFQNFTTGHAYSFNLADIGTYYRQYENIMEYWLKALKIPILTVQYEELVENQEAMSRKMIEFAGLPWDNNCLRFHESKRPVITASFQQVREPIYKKSAGRWKNYEKYLGPLFGESVEEEPVRNFTAEWSQELMRACREHNSGNRVEARGIYEKILAEFPDHPDALHLLGVVESQEGNHEKAVELIERAIKQRPSESHYYNNIAEAYRKIGKYDEALAAYKKAVELKPDYAEGYYNYGNLVKKQGKNEEAIGNFKKALTYKPGWAEALSAMGNALSDLDRQDDALKYFREAIGRNPEYVKAVAGEAKALMRKGQFDVAWNRIRPYLENGSRNSAILAVYGQLAGKLDRQRDAIQLVENALKEKISDQDEESSLYFCLAHLNDEIGEYDAAFRAIENANRLKPWHFDRNRTDRFVEGMIGAYPKASMKNMPKAGNGSDLPVFILGMPRSGTSLVEQIIDAHPRAHGAGELPYLWKIAFALGFHQGKEQQPEFHPESIPSNVLDAHANRYLEIIRGLSQEAIRVTDKMPQNFLYIGLIEQLFPDARIIHCKRDPRDVGLSIFFQSFSGAHAYSFDLEDIGFYYGKYERLMAHWKDVVNIPIMDLQYEELVKEPEIMSRKLIDFIGLPWDEKCLRFYETKRSVITASYKQVREPVYSKSVGRWRNYEQYLGRLTESLDRNHISDPAG